MMRSNASNIMMEFPRTTTMPMLFLFPSLASSTASSITRFINGSNPLKIPTIFLPPFSLTVILQTKLFDE